MPTDAARAEGTAARVTVLGLVQLLVAGRSVPLTPSERAVLAGIAVASPRTATATSLAEWVWGGYVHASPRNRVQALVSSLRRKAGSGTVIDTVEGGYRLHPAVTCDLEERNRLRHQLAGEDLSPSKRRDVLMQAVGLAGGEPLDGCQGGPDIEVLRRRLHEEQLELLSERISADLANDHLDGLVPELRLLTQAHPFHEAFTAHLMRALSRTGRQAEALATYRAIHRRLDEELGIRPGALLTAAHEEVLGVGAPPVAAPNTDQREAAPAAAPSRPSGADLELPPPRTAPRAVVELIGRERELANVVAEAQRAGDVSPLVLVTGLGGMGKSALAIESAHRLRDLFPDGTLYLDLQGETGRSGVASVLELFLRLLGVPADGIPPGREARAALFRSMLDDRRVLIVLDDVPDGTDVDDLLPARASSMAILTSRTPVAGTHPALHVRLRSLGLDAACRMLEALTHRDRPELTRQELQAVADECRGLPLLLRVTAQRLARRPDLSPRHLAESLAADIVGSSGREGTYRAVEAGLGLAGAQLPSAARDVLSAVAHLPFPRVSPWVFGVVAGADTDGDAALDLLQDASLVEPVLHEHRDVQFQLHDLVRLHARRTATGAAESPPVAARVEPVALHLLDLARSHAQAFPSQLLPPPPDPSGVRPGQRPTEMVPEDALRFFATEQDTILACARHTAPEQPGTAWRLLATMGNLAQGTLEPGLWMEVADAVRLELQDGTTDGRRGQACLDLVEALLRHEAADSVAAIPLATRARRALLLEGDVLGALTCAVVLGRAHRAAGRGSEAEEALRWADRSCTPETPTLTRGYIELAWGSLYDDYDRLRPARDKLRAALDHLDGTHDWAGRATAQSALARVHRRLGEYDQGLPLCDQAMDLFRRLGDANGCTFVLDTRADLLVHMGDHGAALPPAREAVTRASLHHDSFMLHRAQRTLGRALAGVGAMAEAEEHLWSSAHGFEALQRPLSLAASLRDIGRLLQLQGRVGEARATFLRERDWLVNAGLDDLGEIDGLIARLDARHVGEGGRDAG